ncbi:hypothetical protein KP509_17G007400 [Ceratopteris richardii]|uniref:Protein kinase domain-containing protein n=1 Tax=Ceratopteris richardii TaxID=49495 RepID=A0A8T2SRY5_CERRI|nr:hypothetical protein KP509_17G007400 [Ceratopteris richardii]
MPGLQRRAPAPGRWLRGCRLGSGSFGNVSLGLSLDDGLLFAVKSAPLRSSLEVSSLQNELHVLRMLDSPRVVACLGAEVSFVDHAPSFNIFLEYMPEGSIADLIQRTGGKLDEMTATACTRAIVEGLCYLHSQGIVHSDIKARNILLGSSGEIKIADFGAARKTSCTKDSDSVSIGGTPLWMAPEVLQGLRQGAPSDIWSLGCTLIEMLEGRPPWNTLQSHPSCTDLVSVLLRIACASETLPPYGDSISSQAKDFLSKCLRRDPAERWTAEQLLQHPFVMTKEGSLSGLVQLLSPRSVLDFYTDSDEDSIASSDPLMDCTCTAYPSCPGMQEMEVVVHDDMFVTCWHTIRCAESWSETRQKSFFNAGEKLTMKRGSDVSFESVKFLTTVNRKERGRREGNCMDIRRSPAQQMQSLLT